MQDVFSTTGNLALTRSRDKLRSLQVLSKNGVDLPRTVFASNKSNAKDVIALSGGTPLVLKILEGTQGVGVVLVDSKKQQNLFLMLLWNGCKFVCSRVY